MKNMCICKIYLKRSMAGPDLSGCKLNSLNLIGFNLSCKLCCLLGIEQLHLCKLLSHLLKRLGTSRTGDRTLI